MTMSVIWTAMAVLSVMCGLATGRGEQVAAAAVEGAGAAVELCLGIAGMLCLWMGVMEVMRRSGLSDGLSRLLRPVLRRLYPEWDLQTRLPRIGHGKLFWYCVQHGLYYQLV